MRILSANHFKKKNSETKDVDLGGGGSVGQVLGGEVGSLKKERKMCCLFLGGGGGGSGGFIHCLLFF